MQTEMVYNDARLWTVKFTYQQYVRCRGAIVKSQCREEQKFPAQDEGEARQAARQWVSDKFYKEYRDLPGSTVAEKISHISETTKLTRQGEINFVSVVPY